MKLFILLSGIAIIVCLIAEKKSAVRHRRALRHVIHVNGTRGKSTVTRLIAAGLTGGGYKVFCKTTGTLPMTIDPEGREKLIKRRGSANISEQIRCLRQAAESGAEILVVECMAVDPELQKVCEHRILHADIGVITNARVDHVAEMGSTVGAVCEALSNTVPENGILFTADRRILPRLQEKAVSLGSQARLAEVTEDIPRDSVFPENTALALAVCMELGCSREAALAGMENVIPDPYTASSHRLPGGGLFINGMSANDPVSTGMVLERLTAGITVEKTVLVLNCRSDRGYRTGLMTDYIASLSPDEVWLMGGGSAAAERRLKTRLQETVVRRYPRADALPLDAFGAGTVIYAIGNIAGNGIRLMERVKELEEKGGAVPCTDR